MSAEADRETSAANGSPADRNARAGVQIFRKPRMERRGERMIAPDAEAARRKPKRAFVAMWMASGSNVLMMRRDLAVRAIASLISG